GLAATDCATFRRPATLLPAVSSVNHRLGSGFGSNRPILSVNRALGKHKMNHPLLYEINTRCWLRELSAQLGRTVSLGSVPDEEFERWRNLGFTHIWLMGVWPIGPRSRAVVLAEPSLRHALGQALPDWKEQDVSGSPFAVADYTVASELGGDLELKLFRSKLHDRGLRLLIDFVPNHLGIDHPWVVERPELFVQIPDDVPETFL